MDTSNFQLQKLLCIAGISQILLAAGSLGIPSVLKWRAELAKVQPLIKQMFWTYAGYIFVINLCFGLLSVFDSRDLINGSGLAIIVTGFIAAYWISRLLIQFLYFDRRNFPKGLWNRITEIILIVLFVFLSITYGLACYSNYQVIK